MLPDATVATAPLILTITTGIVTAWIVVVVLIVHKISCPNKKQGHISEQTNEKCTLICESAWSNIYGKEGEKQTNKQTKVEKESYSYLVHNSWNSIDFLHNCAPSDTSKPIGTIPR